MIEHFGVNCVDLVAAGRFYDAVLEPLGYSRQMEFEGAAIAYGPPGAPPQFWISTFEGMGPNRESHFAFSAADRAHVRAFHDAAVAAGAEVLHEPRLWPEYHETYYGAFVRDTEGNNVEACCHGPE